MNESQNQLGPSIHTIQSAILPMVRSKHQSYSLAGPLIIFCWSLEWRALSSATFYSFI